MNAFWDALTSPGGLLVVGIVLVAGLVCVVAAWIEPCGALAPVDGEFHECHRHRWHRGWHESEHAVWLRPKQRQRIARNTGERRGER